MEHQPSQRIYQDHRFLLAGEIFSVSTAKHIAYNGSTTTFSGSTSVMKSSMWLPTLARHVSRLRIECVHY